MKFLFAALLCVLTYAMAAGHGFWTRPILADDQLYFYMTERCASGVPPHVAHMEVKTQLPTMIGGTALATGRLFGVSDVTSGRTACTAAAAVVVILVWLLTLELTGIEAAAVAAAAGTFAVYGLFLEAATGFQPKVYMMVFMLGAHLACARRKPFVCGVLGMCAFLCWQPAALVLAACGLATLLDRHATWGSVARIIAGALVALLGYEAWFALHGALDEQLYQELLAFGSARKPINWSESAWFILTESRGFENAPHVLPTLFAISGAIVALASVLRPGRTIQVVRERPGLFAFWIAALLATSFTVMDHQAHPDMLLVQGYFAVAGGIAFGWLVSALRRMGGGRVAIAIATAAFAVWAAHQARIDVTRSSFTVANGIGLQYAQANLLDVYDDHRGSMWVLGSVHLLGFNHKDNWTSVGNVGRETAGLDMQTYRPLRDGQMPAIIVSGRGIRPGFRTWLNPEYVDITPATFAHDRIRIYSRKMGAGSGFDRGTAPKAVAGPGPTKARPPAPGAPAARSAAGTATRPAAPAGQSSARPAPGAQGNATQGSARGPAAQGAQGNATRPVAQGAAGTANRPAAPDNANKPPAPPKNPPAPPKNPPAARAPMSMIPRPGAAPKNPAAPK